MAEVVSIEGLRELQAALKRIDGQSQKKLRVVLNDAVQIIAEEAKGKVPTRSGRAAGSIKAQSSQREAQIKAGGGRAPYYPWLDFGGAVGRNNSVRRPFIKDGRYLYPTYKDKKTEFIQKMEEGLIELIESSGLKVD